jgi:hypothetical protein
VLGIRSKAINREAAERPRGLRVKLSFSRTQDSRPGYLNVIPAGLEHFSKIERELGFVIWPLHAAIVLSLYISGWLPGIEVVNITP